MSPTVVGVNDHSGGAKEQTENWSALFALLSIRCGWTPDEMSRMTIAQLVYYAKAGTCSESGGMGMNREQAIALTQRKQQQRAAELAALQEVLFDEW